MTFQFGAKAKEDEILASKKLKAQTRQTRSRILV